MDEPNALEDLLDRLVAEYTDAVNAGRQPDPRRTLELVPPEARPGLERCLKAIDAGGARAAHRPLLPGARVGRFEILRELGRGGMAQVFLARDLDLRRAVALKVLRPGLAIDQAHVDRFLREGRAMARLEHPGVVSVHDVGVTDGWHWIAMESIEGPSLATVVEALAAVGDPTADDLARAVRQPSLAQAPTFEAAVAALLEPAALGLAAAHGAGLVHRDIKPSNVLVHPDGRAVLADFGLAHAEGEPALSLTGAPIGTPHYMAPEQAELSSARVDERTDVYGFGAMLYEVLCQQRPYEGESVLEVLDAIRHREPRPLRAVRRSLGDDAEAVCERAMQRDPDRRYASADALLEDLRRLAAGQLTEARRSLGGPARRFLHRLGASSAGGGARYTSSVQFLGFPLLEVVSGARAPGAPMPTAVAWLAIGPRAIGAIAIGGISVGGIALGGIGLGLVALGGLALGGIAGGGTTVGARAFGGIAVGDVAVGGLAVGRGALGGLAIGKYAIGGNVVGAEGRNEEAQRFFREETFPLEPVYAELLDTVFAVPPRR
ncbi:MAG: serine/threonine-protein kinase [Planctomycetota bacterium]